MKKRKIKLENLQVKSFVTTVDGHIVNTLKGGTANTDTVVSLLTKSVDDEPCPDNWSDPLRVCLSSNNDDPNCK